MKFFSGKPVFLRFSSPFYDKESNRSVKIVWNQVIGSRIRYEVQYTQDDRNWYSLGYNTSTPESSKSGLTFVMTYYFRVRVYESNNQNDVYGLSIMIGDKKHI